MKKLPSELRNKNEDTFGERSGNRALNLRAEPREPLTAEEKPLALTITVGEDKIFR